MRIVRILTRLNIGGPSIHAALLSNQLDPRRFSTTLIVGTPEGGEGDRTPWVTGGPARVVCLKALQRPLRPWRDARAFAQILRVVWRERPRILHTHMAKAGFLGRMAGLAYNRLGPGRRGGPSRAILLHTFHGHVLEGYFPGWVSRALCAIERWMARRTDCLIAVSPAIRDDLLARGIGAPEQWRVVPLGLDLSRLTNLDLPNGSAPLRCGMVGRLVPIKNPGLFLQAVARLSKEGRPSPVKAVVIGDGPLREELERAARQLHLNGTVTFTGWRDDLPLCYQELDVVVLTSWNEGTPVSLIEAMAAARPVVATDVGGVRDLLGPVTEKREETAPVPAGRFLVAERGLLVRPGDVVGLSAAIESLAANPALRRQLGERGRAHARAQFSHERLLREIADLYEELDTSHELH